jgi:hypothetical protein
MKNKSLLKYLFFGIIFLLSNLGKAQVNVPYTRIGIGDLDFLYSAKRAGMGLTGIATPDNDIINAYNPAAFSFLNLTRFEIGVKANGEFQSYGGNKNFYGYARFNGFSFGFPVSSVYGVGTAFGIIPVSNVSYNISGEQISGDSVLGDYTSTYTGKGGISKIFLGASYRLPFDLLTIGATFDYYFGNIQYNSSLSFSSSQNLNTSYDNSLDSKGLGSTIGVITPNISGIFGSKKINDFRIGASVEFVGKLSADTMLIGKSGYVTDTISSGSVKIKLPYLFSAGVSMTYSNNYLFSAEYMHQPWNKYEYNGIKSNDLRTLNRFAIGFEYHPPNQMSQTFWEQIQYRAGLSLENSQYEIYGEGLNIYSVYGGISFPLNQANSFDIGVEYSMQGPNKVNLINENAFTLSVGLNLGELWFVSSENQ